MVQELAGKELKGQVESMKTKVWKMKYGKGSTYM